MCQTAERYGYDISGYSNNGCFLIAPLLVSALCRSSICRQHRMAKRTAPARYKTAKLILEYATASPITKENDKNNVFSLNGFVQKIICDTYIKKSDQEPQRTIKCGDMMDAQFIKRYSLQPHAKIKYSEYQRIFPKGNKQPFCS